MDADSNVTVDVYLFGGDSWEHVQPTMIEASGNSLTPSQLANLSKCEERIDYCFQDKDLLHSALTHASGADHRLDSNERLEFLGDSILGFVVCDLLFRDYPEYLEGDLTKVKSVVVSRSTCAKISRELGLEEFLIVGKGMASTPSVPFSLLADVFESLVAAIYIDGGLEHARYFIEKMVIPEIESTVSGESGGNYKSLLQQIAQRDFGAPPVYHLVDEKGPDHSKCFQIVAQVGKSRYTPAWGKNKKEAEQRSAHNALAEIRGEIPPYASQ